NKTRIDIDLMLDYTRVLYADLLEAREQHPLTNTTQTTEIPTEKEELSATDSGVPPEINAAEETPESIPTDEKPAPVMNESKEIVEDLKQDWKGISFEPPSQFNREVPEAPATLVEEPQPESLSNPQPSAIQGFTLPKDIRKAIGINDKYLYLNELFNNHKSNYEETLDRLGGLDNYQQAEEWLWSGIAKDNHWTREDATVEDFFSMLQKFFASR